MQRLFGCFALLALIAGTLAADEKVEAERFDLEVREDLFAGFGGDADALARGMKKCDEAIAKNPKNAEALVWRGAARVYQSGLAFQNKKVAEGFKLWTAGNADMDQAVKLDPQNVGVLIPRAAVLMQATRNMPAPIAKPVLESIRDQFELVYDHQKDILDKLGTHPLGELRMGLADVHRRLGNADKSRTHLEAILKELPKSKYARRAEEWLAAKPDAKLTHTCIGCHTK